MVMAVDQDLNFHNEKLFQYYDSRIASGKEEENYLYYETKTSG